MIEEFKKTAVYSVTDDEMVVTVEVGEGKIGSSLVFFRPPNPDAFAQTLAMGMIKEKNIGKGSDYRGGELVIETTIAELKRANNRIAVHFEILGGSWETVCPGFDEEDVDADIAVTELRIDLV